MALSIHLTERFVLLHESVGGCGVIVFNAALLGCWIGDSNLHPVVGNIFRTADQF